MEEETMEEPVPAKEEPAPVAVASEEMAVEKAPQEEIPVEAPPTEPLTTENIIIPQETFTENIIIPQETLETTDIQLPAKRKLEEDAPPEQEQARRKRAKKTSSLVKLNLSLEEVQTLIELKKAADAIQKSFATVDALLLAVEKALHAGETISEEQGIMVKLRILPTHLTRAQLIQFRAQLLAFRLLIRNMQPPDRVLHTARGGYNKKETEYAEYRRNLLPNIPETILEMNEYDKQSRVELANRRAKFWTDLQSQGY